MSDLEVQAENRPRIALLPEHLIDQIKAGEVLESCANMAKELIENAIDAQATHLILKIKKSPLDYFSLTDNGVGIHPEDLPLLFARHATSKLQHFSDLYQLSSYGFRGEALASLGAVVKVTMRTRRQGYATHQLTQNFGKSSTVSETSFSFENTGTEIIVTDLFQETPVRLKFLQNKVSEMQKFQKMLNAYLIATPQVRWDIYWDEDYHRYDATNQLQRAEAITGTKLMQQEMDYRGAKIQLLLDPHPSKKKNYLQQYIFANQRLINFPSAHAIISQQLIPSPAYVLFIKTENEAIDVNVHPAKTEVKFLEKATVLSLLNSLLKIMLPKTAKSIDPLVGTLEHKGDAQIAANLAHKPGSFSTTFLFATNFPHFFLVAEQGVIQYLLRLDYLLTYLLYKNTTHSSLNLLVAKPIKLPQKKPGKAFFQYWEEKGLIFATNANDQIHDSIILKAVPESWLHLNYSALSSYLLHQSNYLNLSPTPQEVASFFIGDALEALIDWFPKNILLAEKILQPLDNFLPV